MGRRRIARPLPTQNNTTQKTWTYSKIHISKITVFERSNNRRPLDSTIAMIGPKTGISGTERDEIRRIMRILYIMNSVICRSHLLICRLCYFLVWSCKWLPWFRSNVGNHPQDHIRKIVFYIFTAAGASHISIISIICW